MSEKWHEIGAERRLEMRVVDGFAGARRKWKGPGMAKDQFIDQDCLFAPRRWQKPVLGRERN